MEDNLGSRFRPESWYLPYKSQFKVQPDNVVNNTSSGGSVYEWYINGSKPNTAVTLSVDGGSYTATGFSTDENGYAKALGVAGALGVPDGAHVFRFKVGNMSYLPTTVTFTFSP